MYSLPDGLRLLIRLGTSLNIIPIKRLGKSYDLFKSEIGPYISFYKKNIQNDTETDITRDCILFIAALFFVGKFVYFLFYFDS